MNNLTKRFLILAIFIPGILSGKLLSQEKFKQRRSEFMSNIGSGIAIFVAPEVSNRNSDIDYEYRQNSNIYYLTGFEEPEFAFMLIPGEQYEYIMFVKENTPFSKQWFGDLTGIRGAMEHFGADTAYSITEFYNKVSQYLRFKDKLYYDLDNDKLNSELLPILNQWNAPKTIVDPSGIIEKMRTAKSEDEIQLIKKSVDITCNAMKEAAKKIKPGVNENEIMAIIEYNFRISGAVRNAFPSIVGSGKNSLALHYSKNNCVMNDGDLVTIDIGGEYNYYASDITRTFPVNGKFSDAQREIYEIVLSAQEEAIPLIQAGNSLREVESKSRKIINEGLLKLGLLTDLDNEWQQFVWYAHGFNHSLGIDVHDAFYYNQNNPWKLKEGMVLAFEPGVYISEENLRILKEKFEMYGLPVTENELNEFIETITPVVKKYENIGIRIEDDILVTSGGCEILSKDLPKSVESIETLMK